MPFPADAAAVVDALDHPAACLDRAGTVLHANRALRVLAGPDCVGRCLAEALRADVGDAAQAVNAALAGSGTVQANLAVESDGEPERMRVRASRMKLGGEPCVLVRMQSGGGDRFRVLSEQVELLKQETRERQKTEAILTETVNERELLLRELHHRVKNNMHMLGALLNGAAREAKTNEARGALKDIGARVAALGTVQQMLYKSDLLERIDGEAMVTALADATFGIVGHEVDHTIDCDSIDLPVNVATSLALIFNELLTNALKYGQPEQGRQTIAVALEDRGDLIALSVNDNGPGCEPQEALHKASGIGLVRGLLRQLGGNLTIESIDGTRCVATFKITKSGKDL
ncbi:sensor histidine kinase [Qipengyuania marisflavi]|uniref:sensor histidine kinase n=1 Tax=Qipengyuania marisflavi TaxID=2486356 RepID=UPI0014869B54|nr:sensor histidine kinase [Qipengyuania marisflavi]